MKLGFALPIAGAWATPENQMRVARHAEELGYHSLWVFQRLLYATHPQNEYPPVPGPVWPKAFESVVDPLITLAYVAAGTTRIRLGTSVLIMQFYNPAMLAKQLATLDHVCAGRLDVGLGVGWSKDEFEAVGEPHNKRGRQGDEFIHCLKAIWTQDEVEFNGEFYRIPKSKINPKPLQKPYPPLTIGGYSSHAVKRAVAHGAGFMGGNMALESVAPLVAEMRGAAAAAGQDPATVSLISRGTYRRFETPQGPQRRPLFGTLEEIRADIAHYAEAGLTELFLEPNFDPDVNIEGVLEVLGELAPAQ